MLVTGATINEDNIMRRATPERHAVIHEVCQAQYPRAFRASVIQSIWSVSPSNAIEALILPDFVDCRWGHCEQSKIDSLYQSASPINGISCRTRTFAQNGRANAIERLPRAMQRCGVSHYTRGVHIVSRSQGFKATYDIALSDARRVLTSFRVQH